MDDTANIPCITTAKSSDRHYICIEFSVTSQVGVHVLLLGWRLRGGAMGRRAAVLPFFDQRYSVQGEFDEAFIKKQSTSKRYSGAKNDRRQSSKGGTLHWNRRRRSTGLVSRSAAPFRMQPTGFIFPCWAWQVLSHGTDAEKGHPDDTERDDGDHPDIFSLHGSYLH